jgi:hypothetical protein
MQKYLSCQVYGLGQGVPMQSQTRDRIQWQLALRNLALQQSKYFPTFQQWLQNHNYNPMKGQLLGENATFSPLEAQGLEADRSGISSLEPMGLDNQRYRRWCSHVRTCLFIGNPVLDYQEWCSQ